MEFDKELLKSIQKLADHFALETVQKWTRNIQRRKLVNTRDLLNSLDAQTRQDLGRLVVVMDFAFQEYGRFHDMKKKRWTSQPPVDEIIRWIEKKGLAAFGKDPRPYKTKPKTDERRKNEIAWGIAKKMAIMRTGPDARPWFSSTLYSGLNALYEELIIGVQDRTIEAMKESLTRRIKGGAQLKIFN